MICFLNSFSWAIASFHSNYYKPLSSLDIDHAVFDPMAFFFPSHVSYCKNIVHFFGGGGLKTSWCMEKVLLSQRLSDQWFADKDVLKSLNTQTFPSTLNIF